MWKEWKWHCTANFPMPSPPHRSTLPPAVIYKLTQVFAIMTPKHYQSYYNHHNRENCRAMVIVTHALIWRKVMNCQSTAGRELVRACCVTALMIRSVVHFRIESQIRRWICIWVSVKLYLIKNKWNVQWIQNDIVVNENILW